MIFRTLPNPEATPVPPAATAEDGDRPAKLVLPPVYAALQCLPSLEGGGFIVVTHSYQERHTNRLHLPHVPIRYIEKLLAIPEEDREAAAREAVDVFQPLSALAAEGEQAFVPLHETYVTYPVNNSRRQTVGHALVASFTEVALIDTTQPMRQLERPLPQPALYHDAARP